MTCGIGLRVLHQGVDQLIDMRSGSLGPTRLSLLGVSLSGALRCVSHSRFGELFGGQALLALAVGGNVALEEVFADLLLRLRSPPLLHQNAPEPEALILVHIQQSDRSTPFRCHPLDSPFRVEYEMLIPSLRTRMEQANDLAAGRIDRGDVWSLLEVAA